MNGSHVMEYLDNVQDELLKIKETIPKIINNEVLQSFKFYGPAQKELVVLKEEQKKLRAEVTRWKNKCETAQNELRHEKQIHHESLSKISGLKEQLSLEVEYCAKLGSSCCSLLWSLSKHGIQHSTLHTTCVKKFMEIVEETLVNFSHADTNLDSLSDEMKLVEALCGTLTNISASKLGRDYLVENESAAVSTIISILPAVTSEFILKLLLMFLFNITIHLNGQELVKKKLDRPTIESMITKSRDYQIVLGCLRLVESLYPTKDDVLSHETVSFCTSHQNKDIREYANRLFDRTSINEL